MHLHNYSQTKHWAISQPFYKSKWIWKVNGRLQFQNYPANQSTIMSRRENFRFLTKNFRSCQNSTIWNLVIYPSITDIVKTMNTLIQERHNHSEICIAVEVSRRTQKVEIYLANEGSSIAFFSTDLGHFFRRNVGDEFGVMLRRKAPHKLKFDYDIVRIHSIMKYTEVTEYNILGDTKAPFLPCFFSEAQGCIH